MQPVLIPGEAVLLLAAVVGAAVLTACMQLAYGWGRENAKSEQPKREA